MSVPRTIYLVPARTISRPIAAPIQRTIVPVNRTSIQQEQNISPLKRTSPVHNDPIEDLLNGVSTAPIPRKRERLTHLTPEEKLNRRKMKNRVAAQTARDRKKVRSQRLEDIVRDLLAENKHLRESNKLLREENDRMRGECEAAIGSAAFISGPLLRVQAASFLYLLLCLIASYHKKISTGSLLIFMTRISISTWRNLWPSSPAKKVTVLACRSALDTPQLRLQWMRVS